MGDQVGCQDQVAVACGGLNVIHFRRSGAIEVERIAISQERRRELASRLLLVYTGSSRLSSKLAASIVSNLSDRASELAKMYEMVEVGRRILERGPLDDFGRLLNDGWVLKRQLSAGVSNPEIDSIYETALEHGALGGKLLGAGGTGFMVFYVPPDRLTDVERALSRCPQVPFGFDDEGTQLLLGPSESSSAPRAR
jgi:D-glycero-alpha-D-manno-heptose-7-phosphate kinase